jgi:Asp-tRNA(Asn)/Glu-tRNA(Gln) amidotransferase A subunit family amidase
MEGVLPLAKSLDTLGFFTHTPTDMLALWKALGRPTGRDEQFSFAVPQPIPDCELEMENAFRNAMLLLGRAGVSIKTIDIAAMLDKLNDAAILIQDYEGARFHEQRVKEYGARLDPPLVDLVQRGLIIPMEHYDEAKRFISDCRVRLTEIFKSTPVILTPAATGPAPVGLLTTGDPKMNAPWTALGTPAVSIPMPLESGLPMGLQLTANLGQDSRVLHAAVRLQDRFNGGPKI